MFSNQSLSFLLGPLFSKKSWLALDLGVCIAAGISWLGTPASKPLSSTSMKPMAILKPAVGFSARGNPRPRPTA